MIHEAVKHIVSGSSVEDIINDLLEKMKVNPTSGIKRGAEMWHRLQKAGKTAQKVKPPTKKILRGAAQFAMGK